MILKKISKLNAFIKSCFEAEEVTWKRKAYNVGQQMLTDLEKMVEESREQESKEQWLRFKRYVDDCFPITESFLEEYDPLYFSISSTL
ncbi:hypothetical protein [Zooshikella ganghwensis]|nr:hypothetical protein [Zooshikella ganghwensis]